MRNLFLISLLILSVGASAQTIQYLGSPTTQIYIRGQLRVDTVVYLPLRDTTFTPSQIGAVIVKSSNGGLYMWSGSKWNTIPVGSTAWGTITGSIASQSDLITLLNGYQPLITPGYGIKETGNTLYWDSTNVRKVDTVYRLNDSTINYKINGAVHSVLLRGTAAGGINSLVMAVPTVLFDSPVVFTNTGGAWTGSLIAAPQNATTFLAGPPSGPAATPTFRTITVGDLPTNIPNANLANSSVTLGIGASGSAPNFSTASVSLGGGIILNLPYASATVSGPLTAADWSRFNAATVALVTSVNGQTGAVVVGNADSIGGYRIDFTNFHNGYILAIDTAHSKFVFEAPATGTVTSVVVSNDSLYYNTATGKTFVFLTLSQSDSTVKYVTPTQAANTYFPLVGGTLTGTAGAGYVGFPTQSTSPAFAAGVTLLYRDSAGGIALRYPSGYVNALRAISTHTANRSYYFPDSSGTFALTPYTVANLTASTGIRTGIYAARPSASNCQCYYGATDSAKWYYDNGSWITIAGAGGTGNVYRYNILNYGATLGMTGDATPFIQKAMDTCHFYGGGTVYIPSGVWNVTSLNMTKYTNVTLLGEGMNNTYLSETVSGDTMIKFNNNQFYTDRGTTAGNAFGYGYTSISNIGLLGHNLAAVGINAQYLFWFNYHDIIVDSCTSIGINLKATLTGQMDNILLKWCNIGLVADSMNLSPGGTVSPNLMTFKNLHIYNCPTWATHVNFSEGAITFTNCDFSDEGTNHNPATGAVWSSNQYGTNSTAIKFDNCWFEHNYGTLFYLTNTQAPCQITFLNCNIENTLTPSYGLNLTPSYATYVQLVGTYFAGDSLDAAINGNCHLTLNGSGIGTNNQGAAWYFYTKNLNTYGNAYNLGLGGSAFSSTTGTGLGTGGTVTLSNWSTSLGGDITITTGTSPAASSLIATYGYDIAWATKGVTVSLTPANTAAKALSGDALPLCVGSGSFFYPTFTSGSIPLDASTTYIFHIGVVSGQ